MSAFGSSGFLSAPPPNNRAAHDAEGFAQTGPPGAVLPSVQRSAGMRAQRDATRRRFVLFVCLFVVAVNLR